MNAVARKAGDPVGLGLRRGGANRALEGEQEREGGDNVRCPMRRCHVSRPIALVTVILDKPA